MREIEREKEKEKEREREKERKREREMKSERECEKKAIIDVFFSLKNISFLITKYLS